MTIKQMTSEVLVEFKIWGGEKIHQVDFIRHLKNKIVINPRFGKGMQPNFANDHWIIDTGYHEVNNVNNLIDQLMNKLIPKQEHIVNLKKKFDVDRALLKKYFLDLCANLLGNTISTQPD